MQEVPLAASRSGGCSSRQTSGVAERQTTRIRDTIFLLLWRAYWVRRPRSCVCPVFHVIGVLGGTKARHDERDGEAADKGRLAVPIGGPVSIRDGGDDTMTATAANTAFHRAAPFAKRARIWFNIKDGAGSFAIGRAEGIVVAPHHHGQTLV
jgi:hypothetical protein